MEFNELEGANALIQAIEAMYPNWHKFRDLAEAIQYHRESQDKVIASLRQHVDSLLNQLHKNHTAPSDQNYKYLAVIAGGRGPNTWDREVEIFAPNIGWAIHLIENKFESDESIISIEQVE